MMKSYLSFYVKESLLVALAQSPGEAFVSQAVLCHPWLLLHCPSVLRHQSFAPILTHLCLYLHLTSVVLIMPSKVSLINVNSSTVSVWALGTDVSGTLGDYGLFPRSQGLSGWNIISLAVK